MNVVGLDLSLTATGIAYPDGSTEVLKSKLDGVARLLELRTSILKRLAGGDENDWADLVVVEGYSFNSRYGGEHLGELGGVIRLALHTNGVRWIELPPANVKKLAVGKGNCSKDEVLLAAVRRLGYEGKSKDEADALWCREAALQQYGLSSVTLPAKNLEALASVQWPALERTVA